MDFCYVCFNNTNLHAQAMLYIRLEAKTKSRHDFREVIFCSFLAFFVFLPRFCFAFWWFW